MIAIHYHKKGQGSGWLPFEDPLKKRTMWAGGDNFWPPVSIRKKEGRKEEEKRGKGEGGRGE